MNIVDEASKDVINGIYNYLKSDGPGGKQVIAAFMDEFEDLSDRSPRDDPTNLKNHMKFILRHIKKTWDESLSIDSNGNIRIGVCDDETLGFKINRKKLLHNPSPVVWTVYLIRGIGGRYAFVNPQTYLKKKGVPMPPQYAGGFLISKGAWEREGWDRKVGPFEAYEHPASGAPPVPFFKNIKRSIDLEAIVGEAIKEATSK